MARVWDFVGLLARFNWGLLKPDLAGKPGVIWIGVIWYHRVDDYFRVFLVKKNSRKLMGSKYVLILVCRIF